MVGFIFILCATYLNFIGVQLNLASLKLINFCARITHRFAPLFDIVINNFLKRG